LARARDHNADLKISTPTPKPLLDKNRSVRDAARRSRRGQDCMVIKTLSDVDMRDINVDSEMTEHGP
jgi:hypothetical protein